MSCTSRWASHEANVCRTVWGRDPLRLVVPGLPLPVDQPCGLHVLAEAVRERRVGPRVSGVGMDEERRLTCPLLGVLLNERL